MYCEMRFMVWNWCRVVYVQLECQDLPREGSLNLISSCQAVPLVGWWFKVVQYLLYKFCYQRQSIYCRIDWLIDILAIDPEPESGWGWSGPKLVTLRRTWNSQPQNYSNPWSDPILTFYFVFWWLDYCIKIQVILNYSEFWLIYVKSLQKTI